MTANRKRKYLRRRAKLLAKGHTVVSWAEQQGYHPQTVYSALKGARNGVLSNKIRTEIDEFIKSKSTAAAL